MTPASIDKLNIMLKFWDIKGPASLISLLFCIRIAKVGKKFVGYKNLLNLFATFSWSVEVSFFVKVYFCINFAVFVVYYFIYSFPYFFGAA